MLIGSCRNDDDYRRVRTLKELAKSLGVEALVDFKLNFTFENLLISLAESAVGIHSMVDEHFGIGVVECMAAGTIMLAHNSAGPMMDIVVPHRGERTGFLAETEDEYCEALFSIYRMSPSARARVRDAAREHVKKFSQEKFNMNFMEAFNSLCFNKFILEVSDTRDKHKWIEYVLILSKRSILTVNKRVIHDVSYVQMSEDFFFSLSRVAVCF